MSNDTVAQLPALNFQLLGAWSRLDLSTSEALETTIRDYVDATRGAGSPDPAHTAAAK